MTADRPASKFWAQAEQERRALQTEFAAKARRRILDAGAIDLADLSDQARRTLAWLTEGDTPTVDGVAELLDAAHRAGADSRARGETENASSGTSATSTTALTLLRELSTAVPSSARWRQWIVEVDAIGRVTLPPEARPAQDRRGTLRAVSRDQALVLRDGPFGSERQVDQRGRLTLPGWLRRLVGPEGSVLVAASIPDAATVIVTPAALLNELVDELAGEVA